MYYMCDICKRYFDDLDYLYRKDSEGNLFWIFPGDIEHNRDDSYCVGFVCKDCCSLY